MYMKNLLKICLKHQKKHKIYLIHISTDHLFSGNRSFYKETDRTKPLNIYAKTKLKSEKIIKKFKTISHYKR